MKICKKCDETGHIREIKNGGYHGYSCPCGKYNRIMEAKFKNVSIEDLLAYGRARRIEKGGSI